MGELLRADLTAKALMRRQKWYTINIEKAAALPIGVTAQGSVQFQPGRQFLWMYTTVLYFERDNDPAGGQTKGTIDVQRAATGESFFSDPMIAESAGVLGGLFASNFNLAEDNFVYPLFSGGEWAVGVYSPLVVVAAARVVQVTMGGIEYLLPGDG